MAEPTKSFSLSRITLLSILLVGVVIITPFVSYLSVVFGWTNPTQTPPNGSGTLTALNGNIGINTANPTSPLTVNGQISASGNRIISVATPVAGTDAVNKDYVTAQVGGAGGGGAMVTYGVSAWQAPAGFYRPGGALPGNCFRSINTGSMQCTSAPAAPGGVAAGANAPACPNGWSEAYSGYGPFGNIILWSTTANQDMDEEEVPNEAVAATYSVCANSAFLNIPFTGTTQNAQGISAGSSLLGACVNLNNAGSPNAMCNTCRVCYK